MQPPSCPWRSRIQKRQDWASRLQEKSCSIWQRTNVAAIRFSKRNANWFSFISEWRNINSPTLTPKFSPSSPKNVHCKTRSNGRGRIIERRFSDATWQKIRSEYQMQYQIKFLYCFSILYANFRSSH